MEELSEFHFFVLVVVRHVVVADEIGNAGGRDGCFEFVRLCDEPIGELSPITNAFNAEAFAIDPKIAANGRADGVENVLTFIAILIAEDGVCKFLPVTSRAAIVHVEHRVAVSGIDLISEIECGAVFSVGTAVNRDDQRML